VNVGRTKRTSILGHFGTDSRSERTGGGPTKPARRILGVPLAAMLAAGTFIAVSGSSGAAAASSKPPILIGTTYALTGPFSTVGQSQLAGAQAEVRLINQAGGVLGRKLVLKTLNTGSDPQQTISATTALLTQNKLDLFMGDAVLLATQLPAIAKAHVFSISSGLAEINTKQNPTAFDVVTSTVQQVSPLLQYVKSTLHATKIGIMSTNDANGVEFTQGVQSLASQYKLSVVSTQAVADTATTMTTELQQLRSAGAQVVVDWAIGPQFSNTLVSMNDLGWTAPVAALGGAALQINPDATAPPATLKQVYLTVNPTITHTASGTFVGYNNYGAFSSLVSKSVPSLSTASHEADAIKLAVWAWERAGKVNTAAAVKQLNGMSKLPASQLPSQYNVPKGTNPLYSTSQHTVFSMKLPDSAWALVKLPNTAIEGTYLGHTLP
jgi:ABC-type branched-subunit amino acid transport system substrate-binding protein